METIGRWRCLFLLLVYIESYSLAGDVKCNINLDSPIHTVTAEFTSFNIDSGIFSTGWETFNLSSPRSHALFKALAPAILRVGGSSADWLLFNAPLDKLNASGAIPGLTVMSKKKFDALVTLTRLTGIQFLFDLNLQVRYGQQWDPSNSVSLMEYTVACGYGDNLDWELGNEPTDYVHPGQATFSGTRVGEDFNSLRHVINTFPNLKNNRIVGPDLVGLPGEASEVFAKGYVKACGENIDAFTFHHYYFRGDIAHVKDYIDPQHFQNLEGTISVVKKIISNSSTPDLPYWIGETADSWHSGTPNVSDRFASSFLWLEKLGLSAQMGVGVVMRQTIYGGSYGLVDVHLNPNSDYWVTYLHKQLVGRRVLGVTLKDAPTTLRVYAHCTAPKRVPGVTYENGAITVFMLNVNTSSSEVVHFTPELSTLMVDIYLLTSPNGDLSSKFVNLNGEKLVMTSATTFPPMRPIHQAARFGVKIPALSLGFFVFPNAYIPACM